ncbi:hypothetical protein ACFLVO_04315 [Chloroflexota bacterium]
MDAFSTWGISALIGFLLISVLIGWLSLKRVKRTADFVVGRRQMGPWMIALAFGAGTFSSALFVGNAALGYMWGAGIFWVSAINLSIGTIGTWLIMGKRLRKLSIRLNALTFSDLLAKRYQKPILQPVAAGIVFLAMLVYSAGILMGTGFVFEVFFNIPYVWGLVLMVAIVGFYLAAGGIVSTMWNSFFQAVVMLIGVLIFIAVFSNQVGITPAFEAMASTRGLEYVSFPGKGAMELVGRVFFISLFLFAMPHTMHTFLTMKSSGVIRKALPIVVIWSILIQFGLNCIFALSYMVVGPGIYPDKVMPTLMVELLSAPLAAWLMIAVLAASMSTVAAQMLQGAFALLRDIYQARFRPNTSDRTIMRIARLLCIVIAILALLLAIPKLDLISWIVALAMAVCMGSFMAQMVLGLYWRRGTGVAALWAMVLGFIITIVWTIAFGFRGERFYYIHPAIPGVVVNWITFIVVSLRSKPLPKEHLDLAFGTAEETSSLAQPEVTTSS